MKQKLKINYTMLTKKFLRENGMYRWETLYALDTIYVLLDDFMDNEIGEGIEVLDVFDNNIVVSCDNDKYIISICINGDSTSHIAAIDKLEE